VNKIIISLIFTLNCIFGYAASMLGETYLSLKQAEKKWGIVSFDPKTFKTQSEIKKGAMAVDLVKSKKYIKSYLKDVAKEMGDPDSYFFSDTIMAYEITPPEENKEQWHIIFIPDQNLERVKDVKIRKKCCD
jgi:hypothetical protein